MKTNTHTFPREIFAVDYAGFIVLSGKDSYSGTDLLDAEEVGHSQAKANGNRIAKRYNMHNEAMDIILAFVRESKSDSDLVKKAVELLNKDKNNKQKII